jgi:hypothetical protein
MRTFYNRTTPETARSILTSGFRNTTGNYITDQEWCGVWLSEEPPDQGQTRLSALIQVTFDSEVVDFDFYSWQEEGEPYRRWLIPAAIVNCARFQLLG